MSSARTLLCLTICVTFIVKNGVSDDLIRDYTYEHGWRKYLSNRWTEIANGQFGFRLIYLLASLSDEKSTCRSHSQAFLKAYENETLWAITRYVYVGSNNASYLKGLTLSLLVAMATNYVYRDEDALSMNSSRNKIVQDASAQSLEGILSGNTYHMGNFDECLDVSVVLEPTPLHGQYCLLRLRFHLETPLKRASNRLRSQIFQWNATVKDLDYYSPFIDVWKRIKPSPDPSKFPRDDIHWAVCVPSSCSNRDIDRALKHQLSFIEEETSINITGHVAREMCQSKLKIISMPFTTGDAVFSTVAGILTLLVISSSLADFTHARQNKSLMSRLFFCFSAKRNLQFLSCGDLAGTGFDAIHGLRLLFMILAIAGHRYMVNFGGPMNNVKIAEEGYRDPFNMFIMNGMIVVDTFFVYSGCLTAYYLPLELDKRHMNPLLVWMYRIIRLTPVYLIVLLFHATLLENIGYGPLWPKIVGLEAQRCKRNWWTNLLYINNYVDTGNMCMFQTWYLAVDTHLFMIAVIIVYFMWRRPRIGYSIFAVAAVASIAIPFAVTFVTEADAFLLLYKRAFEDPVASDYFQYMYAVSHIRGGPYVVGVATGFLLYKLRNKTFTIPTHLKYIGHLLSIAICMAAQFGGFVFYMPSHKYNVFEASTYNALHRAAWGVGIALNIFLLVRGRIEWGHKVLTWAPLVPISRLTYCAYLLHTVSHLYEVGTLRTPKNVNYYLGTWMFIGDIVVTFALSLLLNLIVEAPFRAIEKSIFGRRKELMPASLSQELTQTTSMEKI